MATRNSHLTRNPSCAVSATPGGDVRDAREPSLSFPSFPRSDPAEPLLQTPESDVLVLPSWSERFVPALSGTFPEWLRKDGPLHTAALAYYAAMSIFPMCLVLIAALGIVSRNSAALHERQLELLDTIGANTSPWLASQLQGVLAGIKTQADVGAPLGLFLLLLAAVGVFGQVESSFQRIFTSVEPQHNGILSALKLALYDRLLAFLFLLATGGVLILVFCLNILLASIRSRYLKVDEGSPLWQHVQMSFTMILNLALFTLLYKALPRVKVGWRAASLGGLLVAAVWQFGQRIVERLVISDHYSAYGVIGSFLAIVLWLYYASAVVFLGAVLVRRLNEDPHHACWSSANQA